MADPISALSLVANIFEVLSFAGGLISAGNQIYRAADGKLEENFTAEQLAEDLKRLTTGLSDSQRQWLDAHGNAQLDADEVRLRNICERCTETAVDLNVHLSKLKVQEGAKFRRLKSYRQALIAVWREDEINRVAARLEKYQQELDTHILVGLRKSAREADVKNSAQFATLDLRTQEILLSLLEVNKKFDTRLDDHKNLLSLVYDNTTQLLAGRRSPSPVPPYEEVARPGASKASPLHLAAQEGDILAVRKGLRAWGADVNAQDQDGCTPLHVAKTAEVAKRLTTQEGVRLNIEDNEGRSALHHAVLNRRLEVIKVLLEAGIDITIEDDSGRKAAHHARDCPAAWWLLKYGPGVETKVVDLECTGLFHMSTLDDMEGVRFFLSQGANVNTRNNLNHSPLNEAARHGSIEIVQLLLKNGAQVEVATDDHGWTPLYEAIRDNRPDVVRLLLEHGANKNTRLHSGFDAINEACHRGHHEIARILIENGARPDSKAPHGMTPLLEASMRSDGAWMRWLLDWDAGVRTDLQDNDGRDAVWHAANGGHIDTLSALLDHGREGDKSVPQWKRVPVNTMSNEGWTPLGCAAHRNHYECVRMLLDAGAEMDIHQGHGSGYTALAEASHHGHVKVVQLFADRGANLERGSRSGFSALSIAAYEGQEAVVRVLARSGANLNKPGFTNKDAELGDTPLMRAVKRRRSEMTDLLLLLGASVNLQDPQGKTALMHAVETDDIHTAEALIAKGASLNVQTKMEQETALMIAASKGSERVVQKLLASGADARLRDWRACTAWNFAVQANHDRKLVKLLGPSPTA